MNETHLNFSDVLSGTLEFPAVRKKGMKTTTLLALAAAAALALKSTASANKYDELVAKGFRWATADGLYACVSKDDVRRMANNPGDSVELKMIEQVKAYFLTPGTIVQVIEGDTSTGTSKIRLAGITSDLWTLTRFLSKHPIKDTYGVIETPETSGLIPTASPGFNAGPTPSPEFSPLPGANASPGGNPTGSPSPNPNETALPNESPTPNATPTPDESPTPASGQ